MFHKSQISLWVFSSPPLLSSSHKGVCIKRGRIGLLLLLVFFFLRVLVVLVVCLQELVPPSEGGGVVPNKVHVVEVMEAGAGVEWDQVERVPRDVVTTEREREQENSVSCLFK